jgi:competence ComEA-like helix-hairpin-helix protein
MWDARQRAVVATFILGLLVYLTVRRATHRTFIPNPQPAEGMRAAQLADRLDPNTATVAEIGAIPNVGDKLAEAIVAYRESYTKDFPNRAAFREAKDLLRVKGIGFAKMEAMAAYLVFPKSSSTTKPGR